MNLKTSAALCLISAGLYGQCTGTISIDTQGRITGSCVPSPPSPATPSVPVGLTATPNTNGQVALAWSASTGSPTAYNVRRSATSTGTYTVIGSVMSALGTQYTDSAAPLGTTQCYTVSAFSLVGESAPSVAACATLPTPPPPSASCAATYCNPKRVLVVVEDNTGPETGTGGKNGSQYVADYYMQKRGIPATNLVHVANSNIEVKNSGPGCKAGGNCDLTHGDSLHIAFAAYQSEIATPILAALNSPALKGTINYIAVMYGVPTMIYTPTGNPANAYQWSSLDSTLAALLTASPNAIAQYNSFRGSVAHIDTSATKTLLVTRLDGATAMVAAGLVDKAIVGETTGVLGATVIDWQGLDGASNGGADSSFSHLYRLCQALTPVQDCRLNNQQQPPVGSGHMVQSAPNTAFAWGWYDLGASNAAGYSFVPGAVGAQLTSNSANCIRTPACSGDYVARWLAQGITATWGAVTEPGLAGYAMGDILLPALWSGYTFGEACYIAVPSLNWMMVCVGDPLYRPVLKASK